MYILRNIKIPYDGNELDLKNAIENKIDRKINSYKIYKKSIDARRGIFYVYQVLIDTVIDKKTIKRLRNDIAEFSEEELNIENKNKVKNAVVVGSGPAGLFCSYTLAKHGVKVHLIERGEKIEDRVKSIDKFIKTQTLNPESNIQFGEGGAGTFSDGKLTSRSKDKRSVEIFRILVENGAPEDIIYTQMPHIGTDLLRKVIINIRKKIIEMGGEFHFNEKFVDLNIHNKKIKSLLTDKNEYKADEYILALGNSSRDTFIMLDKYIDISQKNFAVGFRIEHLQEDINLSQYKIKDKRLPQASYALKFFDKKNNISVYTFCMCPGGFVVAASSEENKLCVNGMSYHDRSNSNANSAIVCTIGEDILGNGNLSGIKFQREIEEKAYRLGGGNYSAPVQRVDDYLNGKVTSKIGKIKPSYSPSFKFSDLNKIYPKKINDSIKLALKNFSKKIDAFSQADAILTGVETRTSSPIRIERKNDYRTLKYNNLRPIGEGAGYAGGIISSALDGLKCAIAILED
ncbi:NAD(P)-binding protein [Anaerococcus sp. WCA-380-WT-2B]|uniref:NAD(P)-binding protein n=1 Tax=Anaerococcus porci TaxID=2652269 RepID=A0A6N7VHI7_9FIRM|nr:FAD-dependent oxidoreductase [Anaerococcus porci]MSS78361.1 NAD(P)-binding protein [Anaerococcus porci]